MAQCGTHTHENLDYNDTETRMPTVQTGADNNTLFSWGIQSRQPHTSESDVNVIHLNPAAILISHTSRWEILKFSSSDSGGSPAFLFLLPPTCCISFPFITSLEKDVRPVCPRSFASARAGFIFPRTSAAVEPCPPWGPFSPPPPQPPPPHWLQGVWAFHSAAYPM